MSEVDSGRMVGQGEGNPPESERLLGDIRALIEGTRQEVARQVNTQLIALYWRIGARIRTEILHCRRAEYGQQVVAGLAKRLTAEYGKGFSRTGLFHMVRFAEVIPEAHIFPTASGPSSAGKIVPTASGQLTWSHYVEIIYLDDPLKREFYLEMCRAERWSVRALRERIKGMLFERTALSRRPAEVARRELAALREEDRLTPDLVFRDPYLLDFLGLADSYSERDLEAAILRELERFLMEIGTDFTFVARQKRMTIGQEDFYLDLLFYHRGLRCLVAIELKLGRFTAAYKGQMELYLRWLDRYERRPGEEPPLGLILCSGSDREQIELLQLDSGAIRVAEYLTQLPERALLESRLHEAVRLARAQIEERAPEDPEGPAGA